jgi:hypothetical protein
VTPDDDDDDDDDEPMTAAPTYVPVLADERELTPTPSWVPEPATSPSDGKHPTTQGVLEKFRALGIQPRTGSKKGEHRGAAKTKRASSTKTKAGSKAKPAPKEPAVKRPRGRPRKNAVAAPVVAPASVHESEAEEEPDVALGGDSEEESVSGIVPDDEVEEEEVDVSLEDDTVDDTVADFVSGDETEEDEAVSLASSSSSNQNDGAAASNLVPGPQKQDQPPTASRRSARPTSLAHYRDLTAQEADVFQADEQRAMGGSDTTSDSGAEDSASDEQEVEEAQPEAEVVDPVSEDEEAGGVTGEKAEVIDLVSDDEKENEPPAGVRRLKRKAALEDQDSSGLVVDEEEEVRDVRREPLAVATRPRRKVPLANYRDLTRQEADHLQRVDHVASLNKRARRS